MSQDLEKKRILITGASGFLGKIIVQCLSQDTRYLVNSTNSKLHDLTKLEDCLEATKNTDIIIHLAGLVLSRAEQQARPAETFRTNTLLALNITEAAVQNGVKRIVFINSVTAYPELEGKALKESDLWSGPAVEGVYAYGTAKRIVDTIARTYNDQYGIETMSIFLPNLYGPGDKFSYNPPPLIPNIILQIIEARDTHTKTIHGGNNGNTELDLLYAPDAAKIIAKLLTLPALPLALNVSTNTTLPIKKIYGTIADELQYTGTITWEDRTPPPPRLMDTTEMRKYLPEFNFTTFQTGIKATVNDFLK